MALEGTISTTTNGSVAEMTQWEEWAEQALSFLKSKHLLRHLLPIQLGSKVDDEPEVFDGLGKWDRPAVEVNVLNAEFQALCGGGGAGNNIGDTNLPHGNIGETDDQFKKLILFSSNDYLALGSHPSVAKAAAKATLEHGMGPRGSALMCGYNSYHQQLESCLADLVNQEDSLLCPTGFAANMSVLTAIGFIGTFSSTTKIVPEEEKVAIFSDELNHASIIDGIRLADRQGGVKLFIYRHNDAVHLSELLSSCPLKKKVVVTDSVFSMDGDVAPLNEIAKLRKKHGFLFVIDEAHATFVCGENGGGAAEQLGCLKDVDIYVSTLSKAGGCQGGFIACSKKWKLLMQSRGRSFMFSTSLPVPVVAGALAAIAVLKKEKWRRKSIMDRAHEFQALTGIPCTSHIIVLIVGTEEKALQISRYLLARGFHTVAIRPPVVPSHLCRLRVSVISAHTSEDIKSFASYILEWLASEKNGVKIAAADEQATV